MKLYPNPTASLVTAPTALAVDVADIKNFLRVDSADDDVLIGLMIKAVTTRMENYLDRKLMSQVWDIFFDVFPGYNPNMYTNQSGVFEGSIRQIIGQGGLLKLPFGPIALDGGGAPIVSLSSYADDDTETVCDPSVYQCDPSPQRPGLFLRLGQVWPTTILRPTRGVRVRVTCGYASADLIPDEIKHAIRMIIAKLYENRGDDKPTETAFTFPDTALMLLEPYRRLKV